MTRLITDAEDWRRVWNDGYSRLTVEREVDGRILIGVTDIKNSDGYAASFDRATTEEIIRFIKGDE